MDCQWPECECDKYAKCLLTADQIKTIDLNRRPELKEDLEGKCHALWLLNGGETGEWNGDSCNCEYIHGIINCKLNPF